MLGFLWDELQIWRGNRWAKRYKQAQADELRQQISNLPCANCQKPVGLNYIKGASTHIKTVDRYFCSELCHTVAVSSSKPAEVTVPSLKAVPPADDYKSFLVGKSSGGMHFEPGRCVQCGQALDSKSAEFEFCSATCKAKAIRPFLSDEYNKSIEDEPSYRKLKDQIEAARDVSDDEYKQISREEGSRLTRDEFIAKLYRKVDVRRAQFEQKQVDAEAKALSAFQAKWIKQRQYVFDREKAKGDERDAKDLEKFLQQAAKDRAKQEEIRKEEERWQPKKFEL